MFPTPHNAMRLEQVAANFSWNIPDLYNIGADVCDKWSQEPARIALIHKPPVGDNVEYTFAQIRRLSNQAANSMQSANLACGDRIAVLLPAGICAGGAQ